MKYLLKILFAIVISTIFFSCKQENLDINNIPLSKLEIQKIANKHNESLKLTFNNLKNKKNLNRGFNSLNNLLDETKIGLNESYQIIFNEYEAVENAITYSDNEISKYYDSTVINSPIMNIVNEYSEYLTESQKTLLLECDSVLHNSSGDVSEIINALTNIETQAESQLSDEEAEIIIIAVQVGKMSVNYWDNNFDDWNELIGNSNESTGRWFSWGEVAGADVAGAVGGAVGAAVVNIVPGAGQVAYGGAILGSAAAGSAGVAVLQIWNHYF